MSRGPHLNVCRGPKIVQMQCRLATTFSDYDFDNPTKQVEVVGEVETLAVGVGREPGKLPTREFGVPSATKTPWHNEFNNQGACAVTCNRWGPPLHL